VTSDDHNQVMTKVGIADLKAHLSEHLRKVRAGRTLTVVDRDTPIAQIVPYDGSAAAASLEIRRATRKPGVLRLPRRLAKPTDSVAVLLADRSSR
jgi:prevent-host-death family protein